MGPTTMSPPLQQLPPQPMPAATPLPPRLDINEVYAAICGQIIKEQSLIIGTLALEQANHVTGLSVDSASYTCRVAGDGAAAVEELINKYRDFFGNAAVEVCKEAASRFITRLPVEQLPVSL